MNGIYLVCSARRGGLPARHKAARMMERAAAEGADCFDRVSTTGFHGVVRHHGHLASAGTAIGAAGDPLLVAGGCWLPDSSKLTTPEEIRTRIASGRPSQDRPLLSGSYLLAYLCGGELLVENDPFGIYPLYYGQDRDGDLLVASELNCLASLLGSGEDRQAIAEVFCFGSIISDRTILHGIRRLPPNHRLLFKAGELQVCRLRHNPFARNQNPDRDLQHSLTEAFEGYLRRFSPLGAVSASLSGGMDSRIAVAAARRIGLDIHAFSTGEPDSLECEVAARFARSQGIPCQIHSFDGRNFPRWFDRAVRLTEGRCPPGHMHFMDAMLTGQPPRRPMVHGLIGDAVMGGDLDLEPGAPQTLAQWQTRAEALMRSFVYWPKGSAEAILTPGTFPDFRQTRRGVADHLMQRIGFAGGYSDLLWFRYHFRVFGFTIPCLTSQILPWADPVTPYLDPAVFEICAGFSREAIAGRHLQFQWALANYPEIGAVERVKDGVLLSLDRVDPDLYQRGYRRLQQINSLRYLLCRISGGRINLRRRETYPYYDQWLRRWSGVRQFVEGILLSEECLDRGWWQRRGLRSLIDDLRIGRDVWHALASILMIEVLLRQLQRPVQERGEGDDSLALGGYTDVQRREVPAAHAHLRPAAVAAGD